MPRPPAVPHEFARQYDQERAVKLRRRAIWYCIIILLLVGFSWTVTIIDLTVPGAFDPEDAVTSGDIITDTLFGILFAVALAYFARRPRSRQEIVRAFQWVVGVAGVVAVAVTPLVMNASWIPNATLDHTPESDRAQAIAILMTIFVLHFLASIFVALSPREGLLPLPPIFGAYVAWVLLVAEGSHRQHLGLIGAFPLAGLPGFAWSWWRYRSFTERFHARAVTRRYAEVTRELAEARRVHEALFPPPIARGSIRLRYRYEPASHIGGDFLFVHPLAVAPAEAEPPLSVVLIDVTGHGVAAALAVSRLNSELERHFSRDPSSSPADVLTALNRFTSLFLAQQCIFATALCMRVHAGEAGRVEWASAGHPPAFLRTRESVTPMSSTAPMLGVVEGELFDPAPRELPMRAGDVILAYTDGLIEAMDERAALFGIEGVRDALSRGELDAPHADRLMGEVEAHRAAPPTDDTLVVEIHMPTV